MKKLLTVLTAAAMMPLTAQAFTVNYTYEGGRLIGQNEILLGDGSRTTSDWKPISGISTTKQWQPGQISSSETVGVMMTSQDGASSFTFPLKLLGMQYNTGGSNQAGGSAPISSGGTCDDTDFVGQTVTLQNTTATNFTPTPECFASFSLTTQSGIAEQPFYFIRPVFEVTESDFENLPDDFPAGQYTGTAPVEIRYYYKSRGGATTFRVLRDTLSIQFDYQPAILNSVTITGEEVIEPVYDTVNNTASGSTTFTVSAEGYFSNGLAMTFADTGPFNLSSAEGINIPYSITCSECDTANLVVDGDLKTTSTIIDGAGVPTITYQLVFAYNNVSVEDVESGTYRDSVTLIFQENL